MRDIKFRAWNSEKPEMLLLGDLTGVNWNIKFIFKNYEIMQFTGLIDMNGVDVYESDILKITNPFTKRSVIKTVWWNSETARFNGIPTSLTNVYEVIGNVYSNPELLNPSNTEAKD
jgi:hypothetical protein